MTPERYQQVGNLYHQALEIEADRRAAFLDKACAGDEALRREVESLLELDPHAGNFIEAPALEVAAEMLAAEQSDFAIGQSIGHYQILSLLGSGGMGEVYLARDSRLGRKVALKLLPTSFMLDRQRVRRFEQEARAASALNHPNILTVYEIGRTDDLHYIAAEFIEGQTLRQMLLNEEMSLRVAINVAIQVAGALESAHAAGVVHRDIKPENIMVRPDGLVKVLDFGLAKLTEGRGDGEMKRQRDGANVESSSLHPSVSLSLRPIVSLSLTDPGIVMGTTRYMAPEQARGLTVDTRADIFSLGVVLYEMIAGRAPFEGATTADVIASLLTAEPPPLSHFDSEAPAELDRIVARALKKDHKDRYQRAADLELDLKHLERRLDFVDEMERVSPLALRPRRQLVEVLRSEVVEPDRTTVELYENISTHPAPESTMRKEVTREVVEKFYLGLNGVEQQTLRAYETRNEEALELYLKGRYCWNFRSGERMRQAVRYFEQAIAKDHGYALAWCGMAGAYSHLAMYGMLPSNVACGKAIDAARRALELAPNLPEAHAATGHLQVTYLWDYDAGSRSYFRAAEMKPQDPLYHQWFGTANICFLKDVDAGLSALRRSLQLDPTGIVNRATLGWMLYFVSRCDEAVDELKQAIELDPNIYVSHLHLGRVYWQKGMIEEAIDNFQRAVAVSNGDVPVRAELIAARAMVGDREEANRLLDEAQSNPSGNYPTAYFLALIHLALGDDQKTLDMLEAAYRERATQLAWLNVEPRFQRLREYPQFRDLLRRLGY